MRSQSSSRTIHRFMACLFSTVLLLAWAPALRSETVYSQSHDGSNTLYTSSWWDPDGSDWDQYVWDDFKLTSTRAISAVTWRGGYDPTHVFYPAPALDFRVAFFPSLDVSGHPYQPIITQGGSNVYSSALYSVTAGGIAGETAAGTFNGTAMYDYRLDLTTPFIAQADTNYWIQIEAYSHNIPSWGLAKGSGGDSMYFRSVAGMGDFYFQRPSGDAAFALESVTVTPEPASVALFGLGGLALALTKRRSRR